MANSRQKLTQTAVNRLIREHDGRKKERHWDTEVSKMFLSITPNGSAAYKLLIVRPDGRKSDTKLIAANDGSPEIARTLAMKELGRMALGGADPVTVRRQVKAEAKQQREATFEALTARFMDAPEKRPPVLSQRTYDERERLLREHILPSLGEKPFRKITKSEVRQLIREIQARAAKHPRAFTSSNPGAKLANECQGVIRAIYGWAIAEDLTEANPAVFQKLFKDTPDKRTAMPEEALRLMWAALSADLEERPSAGSGKAKEDKRRGTPSALAIMLHAVTLQRPAEITTAKRDQFDWTPGRELWRIPAGQTKTNEVYEVPLSPLAVTLFKKALSLHNHAWVFPNEAGNGPIRHDGPKQRWIRVRERSVADAKKKEQTSPLAGVQLYDCRRLGRTLMVDRLGITPAIAEACINHAPDRSMQNRYYVGDTSAEVRRAMGLWGEEVERIVGLASNQAAT
ncbi:MAG: tyrosine-type recombinase/integrase [Hyphomonas sp.]